MYHGDVSIHERKREIIMKERVKLNKPVFWVPLIVMVGMVILSFVNVDAFASITGKGTTWISNNTMWFVCLGMIFMVTFLFLFLFLPIGKKRIGGPDAKSRYKNIPWFAMVLCGSIGSGIIFWGVGQPMTYFMEVAKDWGMEPGSTDAAVKAIAQCSWEWAAQYCFYAFYAVALGIAAFNHAQPLRVSSFAYLATGREPSTWVKLLIDILCVTCIIASVTCSLGNGIMQLSSGLNIIAGVEISKVLWLIVAIAVVAAFILTSVSGVDKGISKLANFNFYSYAIILVLIFVIGPGKYVLSLATESMSYLVGNIFETAGYTGVLDGVSWTKDWPFWQFVGAAGFAPIFGIFFAKISYGRTIKEVVIGVGLLPALFNIIWFCIFGGYAFHLQTTGQYDVWGNIVAKGAEASMFDLLAQLPLGKVFVVVFWVIIFISFVTMANSVTTSAAIVTTQTKINKDGDGEPPALIKFIWGIVMGATAYTFISFAGIAGAKSAINLFDFPLFVMVVCCLCVLIKYLFGKKKIAEVYTGPEEN